MGDVAELRRLCEAREYADAWRMYLGERMAKDPEWQYLGSLAATAKGEWFGAKFAIDRACHAKTDDRLKVQIHFQAGYIARHTGDLNVALTEFDHCLKLLKRVPDLGPVITGSVHYNRALALEWCYRSDEAVIAYETALRNFRSEGMKFYERKALQNLAWVHCTQQDAEQAKAKLDEAEPLCTDDDAQCRQQLVMAYLRFIEGQRTEALQLCQALHADSGIPSDVQSLSASVAALAAIDMGMVTEAETMIRTALVYSQSAAADSRCMGFACKVQERLAKAKLGA